MKTLKLVTLLTIFIAFSSCSSDDDSTPLLDVESQSVSNLFAPQVGGQDQMGNPLPISGEFTKFDFSTGQTTTSATDWDIAFRATTIIINGGVSSNTTDEAERTGNVAAYIATGTMASIIDVETVSLVQDSENNYVLDNWYTYAGPPTHIIAPTPGKILVLKTRDGKYAKVEILSYYKNAPDSPDAFVDEERYFTFNYVYNPNEGDTSF